MSIVAGKAKAQEIFSYSIYIPAGLEKNVLESVQDMAYWMGQINGKKFSIHRTDEKKEGIQLQWSQHSTLPLKEKKQLEQDGQASYLKVDKQRSALIVGTGTNSFINGIYTFMHEIGFRWYMPGDAWTRIPMAKQINKQIDKTYTPSFQNRGYFGTGGIGPVPGVDDKNGFKKDFEDWNRRNRLSAEFTSKGHNGQEFYKENKKVLDQNPSYFCNGTVNTKGRIDITNPKVVDLFTNWALKKIDYTDKIPMVGVDPADGSGGKDDCLPQGMKTIKTWSDKYFWLANKVAERLDKDKSNALVQTYAYASHAAPPSFELNPRVYPIIIPYAFQRVTDPVSFIKMWSEKAKGRPMGIYDYWNITQWTKNEPLFNIYDIPKKLELWKQYNINFIRIESTNAKGPMGHAWWLAAQMMWDVNQSFEDLYQEFLDNNFGAASGDIKNMYDRWSLNYQGAMEVSFSTADLKKASDKTRGDSRVQTRINELKAYVVYLEKYYSYNNNRTIEEYNELIQYINSIHHLRLLQSRALQVLYITPPAGYKKGISSKKVENKNIAVKPLDEEQIGKKFNASAANNQVAYKLDHFQFDIKKAKAYKLFQKRHYHPLEINGTNNYIFYLPVKRKLVFQVGCTNPMRFFIKDSTGKKLLEDSVKGASGYETRSIELSPGIYTFQVGELYRKSRFIFPEDIPLFTSNTYYDNHNYPLQYVYVPKEVSEIVYRDNIGPNKNKRGFWIDPAGKNIKPKQVKFNIYRIEVPPAQRGKIWVLNIGHRSYELLNLPNLFSFNEFKYTQ